MYVYVYVILYVYVYVYKFSNPLPGLSSLYHALSWLYPLPIPTSDTAWGDKLLREFEFLVIPRPGYDVPRTKADPTGLKAFGPRLQWMKMPEEQRKPLGEVGKPMVNHDKGLSMVLSWEIMVLSWYHHGIIMVLSWYDHEKSTCSSTIIYIYIHIWSHHGFDQWFYSYEQITIVICYHCVYYIYIEREACGPFNHHFNPFYS